MDPAIMSASAPRGGVFSDGLGERRRIADPSGNETLEVLRLRDELTSVPSFEFALRERVSRLAGFRHASFGRVLSVDRQNDPGPATLAVVSECTAGVRLVDILAVAEREQLTLDINAALCLIRQLVPAVSVLHDTARDVAHGALGAERLLITPNGRLVVLEYVLGSALEQLRFSHERHWKELGIALPRSAGLPRFDHRADVLQIGIVSLSLILGRPVREDEYPARISELVASAWAISARGGYEPLPSRLRSWLARALQLDLRSSFSSATEARTELDKALGVRKDPAGPAALAAFLEQYQACASGSAAPISTRPAHVPPPPAPAAETAPIVPAATTSAAAKNRIVVPARATPAAAPAASLTSASTAPGPRPAIVGPPAPGAAKSPMVDAIPVASTVPVATPIDDTVHSVVAHRSRAALVSPKIGSARAPEPVRAKTEPEPVVEANTTIEATTPAPAPVQSPLAASPKRSRLWYGVATAAAALIALAGAGIFSGRRLAFAADTGTLSVNTNPPGAQVFVDGRPRGVTPLSLTLKVGAHVMALHGQGEPRSIPVTISAGTEVSQYIELPKSGSPATGQLHVRTEPAGARVSVDGVPRGTTPLTVRSLSPGEHAVLLENDLGSIKHGVTIEAGATASLVVPLSAPASAPVSGWIAVSAPAKVEVYENKQLIGTSQNDRLMMSPGGHEVEIVNEALGYRVLRTVQVPPGKVASIKVDFPKATIDINAIPWAEVWIDGEKVGETPIGNFPVTLGSHDILFRHPELGEQRRTVTVTLKTPTRLSINLRE